MPTTPNMNIGLAVPGKTEGPEWAETLNDAIETVDSHDHTPGRGTPVPASGIDIRTDLSINGTNLTDVRMLRFGDQEAALGDPADKNGLTSVGGDLFYNNGSGVPVKITDGAGLAASSLGGISGLPSGAYPNAGVNFNSSFPGFEFSEAAKVYARMKVGELRVHESGAVDPKSVNIRSAASLPATYDLTLPAVVPEGNAFLVMSATGALSTQLRAGGIGTADIAASAVTAAKLAANAVTEGKLANGSVTTPKLADASVTLAKLAKAPYVKSDPSGAWATTSNVATLVTNFQITITSVGNPLRMSLIPDGANASSVFIVGGYGSLEFRQVVGGTRPVLAKFNIGMLDYVSTADRTAYPPSAFSAILDLPAGVHIVDVVAYRVSVGTEIQVNNARLVVHEL